MAKYLIIILFLLISITVRSSTHSQLVIVTNIDNQCECSLDFIRKLYLGRVTKFRDGRPAEPVIYKDDFLLQVKFYDRVLHSSAPRLRKHWSKLEFSGRGSRPEMVTDFTDLQGKLAKNIGYIGFMDIKYVDETKYRVLHRL